MFYGTYGPSGPPPTLDAHIPRRTAAKAPLTATVNRAQGFRKKHWSRLQTNVSQVRKTAGTSKTFWNTDARGRVKTIQERVAVGHGYIFVITVIVIVIIVIVINDK